MVAQSLSSRFAAGGVLVFVLAGLGWLLFAYGDGQAGVRSLPDPASGSSVATFDEPARRLTIDAVAALPAEAWTAWNGQGYIHVDDGRAVWVRVVLRNPAETPARGVLADTEYFSDDVDFWIRDDAGPGGWRSERSGEAVAGVEKPLWGRTSPFLVDVPARGERMAFLRIADRFAVWSRVAWWPRATVFFATQVRGAIAEAVCYGVLLGLIGYNALLWVRLRHADTGWYVLYAGALAAANFLANGGPALLGFGLGSPGKEVLTTATLAASGVFLVQFARRFLESETRRPRADRWIRRLRAVLLGLGLGAFLIPWMKQVEWLYVVVPAVALTHAVLLALAVSAWRAGVRHARFYLAATGAVFAGALPAVTMWLDRDVHRAAAIGLLGGSTVEVLLLAFALADRFARAQREKNEAQQRLVEETEQRRVIQEAYADELEIEVRERTRDLEAANADKDRMLALLGHDLRGPLTAVTQTAEHVRRGNRTPADAGAAADGTAALRRFADDVAEAGRQMLLLIEDIVLWSRLRVGASPGRALAEMTWLVEPAVRLHRPLAERRKVSVVFDVPPALAVRTDLVLAQALVRNLVSNAVKFARHRVEVAVTAEADGVRLAVRDDGPGLPAGIAARLKGGPAGEERGFGLRLCEQIAAALDVRIVAAAPSGGGTEMSVTLPRAAAEATEAANAR